MQCVKQPEPVISSNDDETSSLFSAPHRTFGYHSLLSYLNGAPGNPTPTFNDN